MTKFQSFSFDSEVGIKYSEDLSFLYEKSSTFITDSHSSSALVLYIFLMVYLIGGLNVLKLKYLYPCLEDLCSIYADVACAHLRKDSSASKQSPTSSS